MTSEQAAEIARRVLCAHEVLAGAVTQLIAVGSRPLADPYDEKLARRLAHARLEVGALGALFADRGEDRQPTP